MHRRCRHRSHRLRLPCFRSATYDGYCAEHNSTCFHRCADKGSGTPHPALHPDAQKWLSGEMDTETYFARVIERALGRTTEGAE